MVRLLLSVTLAVAVLGVTAVGEAATGLFGLDAGQRGRADQLISEFENSTRKIQYCYIEDIHDGRGYTAGRAGFTSATGDLLELAEEYTQLAPDNPLAPLLPRLRELAADHDGSTDGLEGLPDAWRASCQDPRQRARQDAVVDHLYYLPAVRRWKALGLRTALSLTILYDTIVQHGEGDDPDGEPAIERRATGRAGGRPRRAGERRWLLAFVAARRATLAHAHDPATRAGWAEAVPRADALRQLITTRQWNMAAPVRVHTADYDFALR